MAVESRSYRQVMGKAVQALRPHVEVVVFDSSTLVAGITHLDPNIAFENRPETFGLIERPA